MADKVLDTQYFNHHPVNYDSTNKDDIFIVFDDMMNEDDLTWYVLQHTSAPTIKYKKVTKEDPETGERYTEYYKTNKVDTK